MSNWTIEKLTEGTDESVFHSHSYYDIRVFDSDSRRIAAHRLRFAERRPTAEDAVDVGIIDMEDKSWTSVGTSRAWSWQQGPMVQWVPGQSRLLWNDRDNGRFVTRVYDADSGETETLNFPSYAVDPAAGRYTLAVNMVRLDELRPGYGYGEGQGARLNARHPDDDGVWRQSLDGGDAPQLILSLDRAARFLWQTMGLGTRISHMLRGYRYWFNHVKISPDGERFTVKLRYRAIGPKSTWSGAQGVSLTCSTDGSNLRLLTDATSHVIWRDNSTLYLFRRDGFYIYADRAPTGKLESQIAPELITYDMHLRYLPGSDSTRFVFDTPYREEIDLFVHDTTTNTTDKLAHFENHRPKRSEFRCDLHPCPSPDGNKIVVTSLDDGGRQIYLLRRDESAA